MCSTTATGGLPPRGRPAVLLFFPFLSFFGPSRTPAGRDVSNRTVRGQRLLSVLLVVRAEHPASEMQFVLAELTWHAAGVASIIPGEYFSLL